MIHLRPRRSAKLMPILRASQTMLYVNKHIGKNNNDSEPRHNSAIVVCQNALKNFGITIAKNSERDERSRLDG
jgi:hypothetical protein